MVNNKRSVIGSFEDSMKSRGTVDGAADNERPSLSSGQGDGETES